jgi:arylsulfatase A-like enzyme
VLHALLALLAACGNAPESSPAPPSVLWVVWDTVRADRLSLYGSERLTTPFLQEFAEDALVFEDCSSAAGSTVPSHASMFTGLLPREHGADNRTRWLDGCFETSAELFQQAGYQTYLYSANPNLVARQGFTQGFETAEHPWDPARAEAARRLCLEKAEGDRASDLPRLLEAGEGIHLRAAGTLANEAFEAFLERRDPTRPFFAFLNYMEAHEPLAPPRALRARFLTEEEVERSYAEDRRWRTGWSYCYGQRELAPEFFEVLQGVYDAALLELDGLFADLIARLEARGLADTIVVLTSDHGEHLGEHGLLGHRYSLYQELLAVPLVIRAPGRLAPGRSALPASTLDLYRTLPALAGLTPPSARHSLDLRALPRERARIAEYPGDFPVYASGLDKPRWLRRLWSLERGGEKLIWASDGAHELYRLGSDPSEAHDLAHEDSAALARAVAEGTRALARLRVHEPALPAGHPEPALSGIGY